MAKIAFIYSPSEHWIGGKNYYLTLFSDLDNGNSNNELYVFTGKDFETPELDQFDNLTVIRTHILNKKFIRLHQICNLLFSENISLFILFKKYRINYLSHSYISSITNINSIPWVPDFQHSCLPKFFKPKELKRRNKRVKKYLKYCDVIVSSKSAFDDAHNFFNPSNKIHIYRFKPLPVFDSSVVNRSDLKKCFNVKFPFFFLPNQFWKHKNHLIFFEAMSKLKAEGINVNLV